MTAGIDMNRGAARRTAVFLVIIGCLAMLGVALYHLADATLIEALHKTNAGRALERGTEEERTEETMKLMRALKDNPHDVRALSGLGHIFLHSNDPARAETFFARAVKLSPGDAALLRGLAFAQMENGRLAEAEISLQHALQHEHDAESHYLLAVVYARQLPEKKMQAIQQCDAVLADAKASAILRGHAQSLKDSIMNNSAP